jgi:hypothetical protein
MAVATGCPEEDDGSAPRVSGTFTLTSSLDIRVANVLPTAIYDKLDVMRGLRDDPGNTFFDLLEDAGAPLVAELRAVLPDAVEAKVGDWITDAIPDPVKAQIDAVLVLAEASLGTFDVVSELDLPPGDRGGRARATHGLTALRFDFQGRPIAVDLPASDAPPFITVTEVEVVVSRGGENGADARLTLAQHGFGLHYGEYAYQVIEKYIVDRHGVDLRAYLGQQIDCPAVAEAVSKKCLVGVCVGHAAQLEALCDKGLDEAVARLHEKLAAMRFDAVDFTSGTADLWDEIGDDGELDLLDGGVWEATVNLGQGLRPMPAIFTGSRN